MFSALRKAVCKDGLRLFTFAIVVAVVFVIAGAVIATSAVFSAGTIFATLTVVTALTVFAFAVRIFTFGHYFSPIG